MKLEKDQLAKLYSLMVRTRKLDRLLIDALAEGRMSGWYHSGPGEEGVGIGTVTFNMQDGDFLWPHHRSHGIGFFIARGISPKGWVCQHFGKMPGEMEGPSMEEKGISMYGGTIGGGFPITLGWGVAAKKNNKNQVVFSFFGDGASGRGTLHEAMNLAAVWKLPIVYVCENNQFGQFVPIQDAFPREDIADIAASYNMPGIVVDGQDVLAVHEAVEAAVERARKGDGPSLVECKTYRMRAHAEGVPDVNHDRARTEEDKEVWRKRDPILLLKEKLIQQKIMTEDEIAKIDKEADEEIKALDEYQQSLPDQTAGDPAIFDLLLYSA